MLLPPTTPVEAMVPVHVPLPLIAALRTTPLLPTLATALVLARLLFKKAPRSAVPLPS
jgi:hypothetical protein